MEQIKIGNTTFNREHLKGLDLETAKARFKHLDARIVKQAHELANPEPKKKAPAKKPKRTRKDQ